MLKQSLVKDCESPSRRLLAGCFKPNIKKPCLGIVSNSQNRIGNLTWITTKAHISIPSGHGQS